MVLVHEAIHGLCFWLTIGSRPTFGFRGLYAFAAAPGWYISSGHYMTIALAPLVAVTVAGLALLLVAPVAAIPALFLFVVVNAAGAIGDILVVLWLLTRPPATLVQDSGDAVTVFQLREPDLSTSTRP